MRMLTIDSQKIKTLGKWIDEAENIVIIAHKNADGDAMGSSLGWHSLLCERGKKSQVALPNGCPKTFAWMPQSGTVLSGEAEIERCQKAINEADLLICTDFNQPYRIALLEQPLRDAKGHKALIDHHINPDNDAFDIVFSEPEISSASELCYWIVRALYGDEAISKETATCFYTGMRTDTGQFSFSCRQPSLYEATAALIGKEIDPEWINHHINDNFSIDRLNFYAYAIGQRLRVFSEQKVAYIYVSDNDLKKFNITPSELEGLVNVVMKLDAVEVAMLIREEPSRIKISFRAKYDTNVERIAREEFGGGGHVKASGADCIGMTMQEVIDKIHLIFHLTKE